MTNEGLAKSYLKKASVRIEVLELLFEKGAYSDVIREAQEAVELALKGMLRYVGIEPPKIHDVGPLILEHREKFYNLSGEVLQKIAKISKRLRKERELAFYGDIDYIPTDAYTIDDAKEALEGARFVIGLAKEVIGWQEV